jgi:hypothetical protein
MAATNSGPLMACCAAPTPIATTDSPMARMLHGAGEHPGGSVDPVLHAAEAIGPVAVRDCSSPGGWQPSRFLADRAEAERAFALAERLATSTRPRLS